MRRPIVYSLSLQKKGNCAYSHMHVKELGNKYKWDRRWCKLENLTYLTYPMYYACSRIGEFFQDCSMWKHIIPLEPKFIVPEEIPHQLRCRVFIYSLTAILRRASLQCPQIRKTTQLFGDWKCEGGWIVESRRKEKVPRDLFARLDIAC